jgi:predicted glutamine amidotransferase
MHNGQIGGYAGVRRALEAQLPERLYAARRGATDSELLFLLALARIETGVPALEAMHEVVDEVRSADAAARHRAAAALCRGTDRRARRPPRPRRPRPRPQR